MSRTADAAAELPRVPRLPAPLPRAGVSPDARRALRQLLEDADRAIELSFRPRGDVGPLVALRADSVEAVVRHVWQACVGDAGGCALFAVGGFGRGMLFPHSDVDLLALGEADALARQERALEAFFSCLWDIGLRPGQAVRTPAQCRALARDDLSVFTSLLDARRIAGDAALADALAHLLADPSLWPPAAFVEAKRAEQAARFARFDDTAYNLEPNLKDGPGGLRTLDLMRWLGRRVAGAPDFESMVGVGLLDHTERDALLRAERALRRCRFALHRLAGRAEERLLFDYQTRLAVEFGYQDRDPANLAVEQFMQAYYRAATIVGRIGAQLLERCAERLEPTLPPRALGPDFVVRGSRIELRDPDLLLRRPRALIDLFAAQIDAPGVAGLSSQTMRLAQQALLRHRETFADDPDVLDAFLSLLRRGAPAVEMLARMNRHGVLAALLPAFRRVVGRMQYDLFHAYTVDEHTIRVLRNVARFADPAARAQFPLAADLFEATRRPERILLAALFHDIAKGRGGDHSVEGEVEARAFCERLGLPAPDVAMVAWLVRWHLLMSATAQRQDIGDADVVHRFAVQVVDREHLDHLYMLTVADIAGTNPKLWTEWKARLLADLHAAAAVVLRAGMERPPQEDERIAACRARAQRLLCDDGMTEEQARTLLAGFPARSFLRQRAELVAWQARALAGHGAAAIVVATLPRSSRGSGVLFVSAPDRDGLFAAITATLDRFGFTIVSARLFVSTQGRVFNTFELLEADSLAAMDASRAGDLEAELRRVLAADPLRSRPVRRRLSRALRHFQRAPQIDFSERDGATRLALTCSDRPGLLAEVARVLRQARVRVHDARIATFGERVEDFFTLTDEADAPLSEPAREALRAALVERLDGEFPCDG